MCLLTAACEWYLSILKSWLSGFILIDWCIKLIISSNDIINEDDLRKKLNSFFNDVLDKSEQIIKMQNHINDENYSFRAYNFNIEEITRVEGYDYVKVIKIVSMILISCIFFLYVFHIRKLIKLF